MDSGRTKLESAFGREFSQHALNNYRGFRTWGQLNESASTSSSDTCDCCALVREGIVTSAVQSTSLLWLVDVKKLHHAKAVQRRKGESKCGFCSLIYQQFWTWQPPEYRLRSWLLTRRVEGVAEGEEIDYSGLWDDVKGLSTSESTPCYMHITTGNSSKSCATKTCNICEQDNYANLEFGSSSVLCEPCRSVLEQNDCADSFEPVVPLWLKPTVIHDSITISTLAVKHAAGVRIHDGYGQEWIWAMYTLPDDRAAAFIPPFRNPSYEHPGVLAQINAWREKCNSHSMCQRRTPKIRELPTRVLEIHESICQLRETQHEPGEYTALSYCWGPPPSPDQTNQPHMLTSLNFEAYHQTIDVELLPKTLQQAIILSRKLGFKYIWIDSMCIIQDSKADKLAELKKMRQIYAQSSLTICASGARTCDEGFFDTARAPGTSVRIPDVGVNYPCALPDGSNGHVRLIERAEYRPDQEALVSRAWTYEEDILPTRIVRFGACLSWECDEHSEARTVSSLTGGIDGNLSFSTLFGEGTSNYLMRRTLHNIFAPATASSPDRAPLTAQDRNQCPASKRPTQDHTATFMMEHCTCDDGPFFAAWQLAVSNYTDRSLTNARDKLPALGGLAEAFARVRKDEYVAGLWRRRMIHDLMWTARPISKGKGDEVRRREAWRAPSWSWASLDSGIDVVGAHERILSCQLDNCKLLEKVVTAEVVKCAVDYVDASYQFGAVRSGSLTLRGRIIKAKLVKGKYFTMLRLEGVKTQIFTPSMAHMTDESDFANPRLDLVYYQNSDFEGLGDVEKGIDVWCLQMREEKVQSRSGPEPMLLMDGLILLPDLKDPDSFRRIGVWVTDYRGFGGEIAHPFLQGDPQLVKIL